LSDYPDTELLSAELFSIEQLKRHATILASQHHIAPNPGPDRLLLRLTENAHVLLTAYKVVTVSPRPGQRIVPAEAWLLDNFYLIEQQISMARRHLPRGYSRQLPRLFDGLSAGYPRIYDLALELISHMDGRIDSDNTSHFIAAYQTVEPLKLGELWAFPIMLQLALLENLRRVALRIAKRREEFDAAITWADRMLATAQSEPKQLIRLLAEFANADVPLTAPFVEEFYARIKVEDASLAFVKTWVEQKLLEQGVTAIQLSEAAGRTAATNQISIANSIGSLRFIGSMDWRNFVEQLSAVEHILSEDPAGMHTKGDFATRDRYRHAIEEVAKGSLQSEAAVAQAAIALAQNAAAQAQDRTAHVGYYLIDHGRHLLEGAVDCQLSAKVRIGRLARKYCLFLYISPILLLTVISSVLVMEHLYGLNTTNWLYWLMSIPLFVSTSALAVSLVNLLSTHLLPPRILSRLDFSHGIPAIHRTMVVVPTLMGSLQGIDALIEALEIRYLGNRDPNLFFALLTDFHDATGEFQTGDNALIAHVHAAILSLNETYKDDRACIFYLFHRPRLWNPIEQVWMGYERKRGKLEQFNALLRGEAKTAFSKITGDVSILSSIQYVITLDTDTQLPRDTARTLIGNLAHPLNRPVYDATRGRIVEGYAILQPRASISMTSAGQSRFTKLFAGESGMDPYTREVSDVYQDIFGEGSFIGKGIYDVDAFRLAVDGRFPENLILSHDLLESGYARSALVTDVNLIEEHPASYVIEASRRHRWIRGDWQLANWLLTHVPVGSLKGNRQQRNPLTTLLMWKIFDNLRRSLVAPSLLLVLTTGWLIACGSVWFWLLLVIGLLSAPGLLSAMIELFHKPNECDWRLHLTLTAKSALRPVLLALLTLIFLPYDTLICLDAILQSGVRMLFTRRGLLLWHLPSYTKRNARSTLPDFFLEMWTAVGFAIALALVLALTQPAQLQSGLPIVLLLWLLSPAVAWWLSHPLTSTLVELSIEQLAFLHTTARRTWRFFSDFVNIDENWLPPDNFQIYPAPLIASRTSPTNIGMALLANLAACDFGYISVGELLQRTENTLNTMEQLERYRGHFYNWYDTRTLLPLHPQYISSVDSGNLIASLLTLQAGLAELKDQPVLLVNMFSGLQDTLQVFAEHMSEKPAIELTQQLLFLQQKIRPLTTNKQTLTTVYDLLNELNQAGEALLFMLPVAGELHYWARAFVQQSGALRKDLDYLMLAPTLTTRTLTDLINIPVSQFDTTVPAPHYERALERIAAIDVLVERCRELAVMDFEFLYDTQRDLLAIGYDVNERRRDPSCYDLLASEARLASFMLVAQGQVQQKHWFSLGRLLTSQGDKVSLLSWSGSMFEYLMPQLVMPSFENTLLEQTCKSAVLRQIEYGRQRGVPWGISESCYNATDIHQVYQYRAFGVPGLGLKSGLGDDLVIAPYASALALTVLPHDACRNLQTLSAKGFMGEYGYFEAIDYTPSRIPRGKTHVIVQSFMAHHQGMSLLAFAYILLGRPMQRRFMSAPEVRATELLLQERVPKTGATIHPHAAEVSAAARPPVAEEGAIMRVFTDPNTQIPEVHLLSNGRTHVMVNHAGGGYTRWRDLAISRWREDATSDCWGTFVYLRDHDTGHYWSTTYQPTLRHNDHFEAIFVQGRAEYRLRNQAIEAHSEISVSPEDDVVVRRVTLTNLSSHVRHIEVTSYAEMVLAPLNSDLAHRAFSNLFVQTEILPAQQAILTTRRPRTPEEQVMWGFHLLTAPGAKVGEFSYETDRAKFIGRGRTAANPIMLDDRDSTPSLSNTDGSVLDPVVAIRCIISLSPDESAIVQIISGIAQTRQGALALLEKYGDRHFANRAFELAWFQSQEVLRHLNATESDAQIYGRLASSVIYSNAMRRTTPAIIARNQLGQSGLWRFAISGDLPIVLLRIGDVNRIHLVKQVLQTHAYWRMKGLIVDLVILNDDFSGYRTVLHDLIISLINTGPQSRLNNKTGGVFVLRAEDLSEDDRVLLQTVARLVFTDSAETLIEQVDRRVSIERISDRFEAMLQPASELTPALPVPERLFNNGLGGFSPDGREYIITLQPGQSTPAPWVNVIASPHIGTVVSESGSAYTWVENAHEFRLTTWHNDPVSDNSAEAIYIRDEETGLFWSPTPLPAISEFGYTCRHGFGYSVFEHAESGIYSELTTYVTMDASVKLVVVKLHNQSKRPRRLSLTGYWELVLGEWRHANMMYIVTETDPHTGALFARNAYGRECANRVVFLQVSETERTLTGNRSEFIGRNGQLSSPAAMRRKRLSGRTGAAMDPCAAIQTRIVLAAGQAREIVFVFGAAGNSDEARHLIARFAGSARARQALDTVHEYWEKTLGAVQVTTPDAALDVLTNGWLLYQTLSSRLWGRSGYYQSGGAYGFRDQLQDTMALTHTRPELARAQIILCAGRQFLQGDVQHWWHPPGGQGVRTHFSDDYLWLPYAVSRYILTTGDTGVLNEEVHFLEGRSLNPEEEAYYDQPQRSAESASLYEHCVRAIRHGLRFGSHQLPLIGCGDWNDGMNLIGREGRGESVWLAWFLFDNLQLFADVANRYGDETFARLCREQAATLRGNIENNAWDGEWYRRAYFDDGTPLGSAGNDECQIDSISQSWAVISGGGNPLRARQAMAQVDKRLVKREAQLIQLLTPPFDKSALEPGYIKGYVPGVRENGGQYTHAAIWAAMAYAMMDDKVRAWELFNMLNPVNHGSTPEQIDRYKVEPYVMCADIYAAAPHTGRGGWTWYTGASGWMYRLTIETLLGLHRVADNLRITPCIPPDWEAYKIRYRYLDTYYHISLLRVGISTETGVTLDSLTIGIASDGGLIPLVNDKLAHHIEVKFN
jgi:cellobiose phosphorylase